MKENDDIFLWKFGQMSRSRAYSAAAKGKGGVSGYQFVNSELITYTTGLTTALTASQSLALDTFVSSLKTGLSITNLSDAFDVMYILAGETPESSLRNLVKNDHHCTAVNSPAWAQYEGYTGAAGKYIRTDFIPSTDGINYQLNSASLGCYVRTSTPSENRVEFGSRVTSPGDYCGYLQAFQINSLITYLNTGTYSIQGVSNSLGFSIVTRPNATQSISYKNKTAQLNPVNSTGLSTVEFYILALNDAGSMITPTDRQLSFAFAAKNISAIDVGIIVDSFETYMDANGKGIIS